MKILQLVTRRQHRGAEVFATQLSDALVSRGHEVVVVGLYPPPAQPLEPGEASTYDVQGGSAGRWPSPSRIADLTRYIRAAAPDIVQANGSDTLKYSSLVKRLSPRRWPLVYRNISLASYWLRYPGQRQWVKWLLRSVEHVASVSEESRADFRRTYDVPAERISTIPIGVPIPQTNGTQPRERLRALANLPEDARIVAHIGSFSPEKNHLWLIEAFAEILREISGTHLLLFGGGPLRPAVEAAIAEKNLGRHVHLLGKRPDVAELVGGADLFVLPSKIEGIPGVILEAAAQGVPAVATAVGGIGEAVRDGTTGVLTPPEDRAAFVSAVVELLGDPQRCRRMGTAAREFMLERYDLDQIVTAFERLYLTLTGASLPSAERVRSAQDLEG
ncbi:MAG TPA: glycosyltransferase family 4 protein [Chloroflexota bacterium]|nr:glycosyltransferase family 4 protein [Chloroflexota bacterium]